jgi:type IX secretion system PorP/SprF family membrane protein
MKKRLAIVLAMVGVIQLQAQQRPQSTQYILNNFIINPAVAGMENYWDVKISHRHQWVGLNGSPVTTYVTLHGPIVKSDYDRQTITGTHASTENPRGKSYWAEYTAPPPHAGAGLTIINDRTGPMNRFSAYGTFSYHIGLSPTTNLSAGLSAGLQQMRLDADKLDFGSQYPVDPSLAGSGLLNKLKPDFNAGLWLYSAKFFVGASTQNIVTQGLGFDGGRIVGDSISKLAGKLLPHVFLSAGFLTFLNEDFSLLPSVLVKYVTPTPASLDLNAKLQYRDDYWAGLNYRFKEGYAVMLGMNVSNNLNIGYAYDFTASKLNNVTKGTHEIVIGFALGNSYGDWCPRNIW